VIERLYADSIEQSIQRDLLNPGPAPEEGSFSAWSFTKSGAKGAPAGAFDAAGGIADLLSGFATPYASIYEEGEGPATKAMREGRAFDPTAGNVLRAKADEFSPDPATAHRSELVVHGVVKAATKAVTAVVAAGPYAGGAIFGAEEANNEYQRMIQRGIDPETAAKVAGVVGVASAVGAAAPAGGSTVLRTLGIVAATGPATYVAQEKLSKDILQEAGYQHEADLHDPTDALGLMLSIGVPGAVGALHVRNLRRKKMAEAVKEIESGGRRYGADGKLLTSPKGAQGEMQVMPGTATDPGFGVTPAKDNSPDELARVGRDYLDAMQTRYGDPEKALAAYNAGPGAVDAAVKKHGDNWLAHMPDETKAYVGKARRILGEENLSAAARNTEIVDAARVRTLDAAVAQRLPENQPDGYADVLRAMDEVGAGRVHEDLAPPMHTPEEARAGAVEELRAELQRVVDEPAPVREQQPQEPVDALPRAEAPAAMPASPDQPAPRAPEQAAAVRQEAAPPRVTRAEAEKALADLEAGTVPEAYAARVKQRADEIARTPRARSEAPAGGGMAEEIFRPRFRDPDNALPQRDQSLEQPKGSSGEPAKTGAADEGEVLDAAGRAAVKKLEAEQPDMPVKLPGSDETVTVSEAMERIEAQRADEAQEADWVKVALECALSGGPKPAAPEPT
jgi:hypothetical protein